MKIKWFVVGLAATLFLSVVKLIFSWSATATRTLDVKHELDTDAGTRATNHEVGPSTAAEQRS